MSSRLATSLRTMCFGSLFNRSQNGHVRLSANGKFCCHSIVNEKMQIFKQTPSSTPPPLRSPEQNKAKVDEFGYRINRVIVCVDDTTTALFYRHQSAIVLNANNREWEDTRARAATRVSACRCHANDVQ